MTPAALLIATASARESVEPTAFSTDRSVRISARCGDDPTRDPLLATGALFDDAAALVLEVEAPIDTTESELRARIDLVVEMVAPVLGAAGEWRVAVGSTRVVVAGDGEFALYHVLRRRSSDGNADALIRHWTTGHAARASSNPALDCYQQFVVDRRRTESVGSTRVSPLAIDGIAIVRSDSPAELAAMIGQPPARDNIDDNANFADPEASPYLGLYRSLAHRST